MERLPFCLRPKDIIIVSLTLIICVFSIDLFWFPILPNVPQYYARFASSVDADLQGGNSGVLYRNALWKPGIGHWFAKCGDGPFVSVSESFPSKACHSNCSGRGVCNSDRAECRCFHGYSGEGCEIEEDYPCTISEKMWRVSSCGAICDKRKAFCHCGEGTKYPQRQVAEACGFVVRDGAVDWKTPDPSIYENTNQSIGWCNLESEDVLRSWKESCYCTYDGNSGVFCDVPVESFCINQCSGNGQCRGGFCACVEGWHGIDCTVPSSSSSYTQWPNWLADSMLNITSTVEQNWERQPSNQLTVKKQRPLIYVYDLPAELNSQLMEGRHFRLWCATRNYDNANITRWTNNLYGSEIAFLESLLASLHRTNNAEEADFFYVPTLEACARSQADSAPHTNMQGKYLGLRGYYSGTFHKRAYEHIKEFYPYWNRSSGRDHIWSFAWDEGACSAPKEIWNSIMLVHWGNTNSKHNYSTTAYLADGWMKIPVEWRGNHICYDPDKDIVIPAWKKPEPNLVKMKLWNRLMLFPS